MTKSIFKTAAAICLIIPLAGCDILDILQNKPTKAQIAHEQTQASIAAFPAEPDIGALLAELPPAETEPVEVAEAAPVVQPEPVELYEYDHYNADPAGYVCEPRFRSLSCLDDGRPVYLDAQMGQLEFGVHP